jgi:hypothetical protein
MIRDGQKGPYHRPARPGNETTTVTQIQQSTIFGTNNVGTNNGNISVNFNWTAPKTAAVAPQQVGHSKKDPAAEQPKAKIDAAKAEIEARANAEWREAEARREADKRAAVAKAAAEKTEARDKFNADKSGISASDCKKAALLTDAMHRLAESISAADKRLADAVAVAEKAEAEAKSALEKRKAAALAELEKANACDGSSGKSHGACSTDMSVSPATADGGGAAAAPTARVSAGDQNELTRSDRDKSRELVIPTAAHFPLRDFDRFGGAYAREGAVLYENMHVLLRNNGRYKVTCQVTTPVAVQLRLQLHLSTSKETYTLTLAPLSVSPDDGFTANSPTEPRTVRFQGYAPWIEKRAQDFVDISRNGTARFGSLPTTN